MQMNSGLRFIYMSRHERYDNSKSITKSHFYTLQTELIFDLFMIIKAISIHFIEEQQEAPV